MNSDSPLVRRLGPLAIDVVLVVVFAALGARTHHDGALGAAEVADVAWPFLVGLGVAHAVGRAPWTPVFGLVVWGCTVAIGMALRLATGDGTALAFVLVATGFNLATLVGWRLLAVLLTRLGERR